MQHPSQQHHVKLYIAKVERKLIFRILHWILKCEAHWFPIVAWSWRANQALPTYAGLSTFTEVIAYIVWVTSGTISFYIISFMATFDLTKQNSSHFLHCIRMVVLKAVALLWEHVFEYKISFFFILLLCNILCAHCTQTGILIQQQRPPADIRL